MNQPSPGGKNASTASPHQGKGGAMPSTGGKGGSMPSPTGKSGQTQEQGEGSVRGSLPGIVNIIDGFMSGGGGRSINDPNRSLDVAPPPPMPTSGMPEKPNFPTFAPMAQGWHGASSAQQNPNQGGASSSPTSMTAPSTMQGGMDPAMKATGKKGQDTIL